MEPIQTKCFDCKHFKKYYYENGKFIYTCRAFPKGIPGEIILWDQPHVDVRPDQRGNFIFDERETIGV